MSRKEDSMQGSWRRPGRSSGECLRSIGVLIAVVVTVPYLWTLHLYDSLFTESSSSVRGLYTLERQSDYATIVVSDERNNHDDVDSGHQRNWLLVLLAFLARMFVYSGSSVVWYV